jgi:ribosomal protein S12 methylthiotransferase accessory factor
MVRRPRARAVVPFPLDEQAGAPKGCLDATHRLIAPAETLARRVPLMPVMGITRLANLTGLDVIGLPVVMAIRPNARSLAVSSGKGLTLEAAMASGLMEAIELYHAERIRTPVILASHAELRHSHPLADVARLPRLSLERFHDHLTLPWIEGVDLLQRRPAWVPFELVHCNFTLPLPPWSGCFPMTSNGLASGNHVLEAIAHGLCEVIERDALALWHLRSEEAQHARRIDLGTVDDERCLAAMTLVCRAGLSLGLWEITSDIGVPAYECVIVDRDRTPLERGYATSGTGCHPTRAIAAARAITEAVQGRMIYVAGSRDDRDRAAYAAASDPAFLDEVRERIGDPGGALDFRTRPSVLHTAFAPEVRWLLDRLTAAGIGEAIVVDLSREEFGVPVVRVIVPGLEGVDGAPGYVPGPRARAMAALA